MMPPFDAPHAPLTSTGGDFTKSRNKHEQLPSPVRIDLHVHTRRYSACAPLLKAAQVVSLINGGCLDGVVLTDHDVLWSSEEVTALNAALTRGRIYRGMEASSCNGHFILIGINDVKALRPGDPLETIQRHVHAQDGAVIWAHPHQRYNQITEPIDGGRLPPGIDAIEVVSSVTMDRHALAACRLAQHHQLPMVGGSDAHCISAVGQVGTLFDDLPADESALADMIRRGECLPSITTSLSPPTP